jgi:arylsulfatase A-like enzyme/Flp pilus assembly protein TadD
MKKCARRRHRRNRRSKLIPVRRWLCLFLGLAATVPQSFAAPASGTKPAVILITIDTVRADHLHCYGYEHIHTPTIDALARDGIVFDQAIAQVPLTWPSHAAILTGMYPFQNGVQDFTSAPLDARFLSVAQAFERKGYATGAVVSAFVLDRSWGLSRGFGFYDDAFSSEFFKSKDVDLIKRRADESVSHAIGWLSQVQHRPFFLWLHLYDPHSPYDPPEPYRSEYHALPYDGEIAYADHELGRLLAWLKRNLLYDRSLIVLLSDHGESLGEHGEQEHGFFIYRSTVHVPLIVKPPAGSGFHRGRVSHPVETISVAPTLLRFAGIRDHDLEKQFQALSFLGSDSEGVDAEQSNAYSETFYPFSSFGWHPLHALETSRYHYIEAPVPELYNVVSDPEERNNLAPQQPAVVAVLAGELHGILAKNPYTPAEATNSSLSPDAIEKLRSLGYVAFRSPVPPDALGAGLPDPKQKLDEFNDILKAGDAFRSGDFPAGESLLRKLQEQDSHLYIIPFMLGEAALQRGKWEEAKTEFEQTLELNPTFDAAMTALARALHEKANDTAARQWIEKALRQNAANYRAWYELGWIEASAGNRDKAVSAYEKALAIQPHFGLAQRDLAMIYFESTDYAEAARYFLASIQSGLKEAKIFNFLGICYSRTGRESQAVTVYRQALELESSLAEAHLNLGYSYEHLGRTALAQREYQEACRLKSELCHLIESRPH